MSMSNSIKRYMCFMSLVLAFLFILSTEARADLYGFECITNNEDEDAAIGEAQLFLEVTDPKTAVEINGVVHNQVLFTFSNVGPDASSITDVYFEDGALLGIAEIQNGPGVSFSQGASPPNLPGWNDLDPPFQVTAGFLADSDPPVEESGVNPGEYLGILFDLEKDKTFADVIAAIKVGFNPELYYDYINKSWDEPHIRIGIRVQGFAHSGSESFILTPEPASLLLGSIGLCMVMLRCRKRKALIES